MSRCMSGFVCYLGGLRVCTCMSVFGCFVRRFTCVYVYEWFWLFC